MKNEITIDIRNIPNHWGYLDILVVKLLSLQTEDTISLKVVRRYSQTDPILVRDEQWEEVVVENNKGNHSIILTREATIKEQKKYINNQINQEIAYLGELWLWESIENRYYENKEQGPVIYVIDIFIENLFESSLEDRENFIEKIRIKRLETIIKRKKSYEAYAQEIMSFLEDTYDKYWKIQISHYDLEFLNISDENIRTILIVMSIEKYIVLDIEDNWLLNISICDKNIRPRDTLYIFESELRYNQNRIIIKGNQKRLIKYLLENPNVGCSHSYVEEYICNEEEVNLKAINNLYKQVNIKLRKVNYPKRIYSIDAELYLK